MPEVTRIEDERLVFEVFELQLEKEDLEQAQTDRRAYLAQLLEAEGQEVNAILLDPNDESIEARLELWHCTAPVASRSEYIEIRT
jgi:hypothetical protein